MFCYCPETPPSVASRSFCPSPVPGHQPDCLPDLFTCVLSLFPLLFKPSLPVVPCRIVSFVCENLCKDSAVFEPCFTWYGTRLRFLILSVFPFWNSVFELDSLFFALVFFAFLDPCFFYFWK